MLQNIQETIESALYEYEPGEYLQIRRDGELENKAEFVSYKAKQVLGHFGLTHDNIVAFGNKIDSAFTAQSLFN